MVYCWAGQLRAHPSEVLKRFIQGVLLIRVSLLKEWVCVAVCFC